MKLYENITIGNFLFALGYAIRDFQQGSKCAALGSINLLQQTPADQLLADVLLNFGGVARLLEFKAEGADLRKERGKHAGLHAAIEKKKLTDISREVHWYVETKSTEDSLGLLTVPYLDAFPRDSARVGRLQNLVQSTAEAIAFQRSNFTAKQIRDYLLTVKTVNGSEASGSGGLLLLAEPGGVLKFAPLEDMLELNMTLRAWAKERFERAEQYHRLEFEKARAKEKAKEKELTKHNSFDRGLG